MELRQVRIRPWSREFSLVKRLLKSQIPASELLPMVELRFATPLKKADCTGFYAGNEFVGFYYVIKADRAVFLLYLVVNPKVQSKGYGAAILRELAKNYSGKQIDMHIEIPRDLSSPDEQAARRYRFYERAGCRYTGWRTADDGVDYWILSNLGEGFDLEVHKQFLQKDRATGQMILIHDESGTEQNET